MLILFSCVLCVFVSLFICISYHRLDKWPPLFPGWLPLIGHVHLFIKCDPTNVWSFYKKISEYSLANGGVITFSLGPRNIFFVSDPEDAYTIASSAVEKNFTYNIAKPWLGNGLFTSNGAIWKAHRKIMNQAFTQQILNGLMPVFNKQACNLVDCFDKQPQTFNPESLLLVNNLETICKTSLGLDREENQDMFNEYRQGMKHLFETMYERFLKVWLHNDFTFYFTNLKKKQDKILNVLHELSKNILAKRKKELILLKQGQATSDHFRPLLDTIFELSIEKGLLTEKEMQEELDTIIFGGHDTSGAMLTYTLILLGSDKIRQEKAYREICDIMGDSIRDVEQEDLSKLSYIECIIKESLRLYPIAPAFPRAATKDVQLKNYVFRAGASCLLDAWSIHRHPLWGPDAEEFNPERWQDPAKQASFQKAFLGFGTGKRNCIGRPYAMMSLKVILVHVLRRYKITADISKLTVKMDALLRPQSGHEITIEKRN